MRSFFQKKLGIILLAALALGSLTVLALSLDQVSFNEAQKFGQEEAESPPPVSFSDVTDAWATVPLWKQIVLWGLITLMVILVSLLLSPEMRKRLFILFIRASFTAFGIYFLLKNYGHQLFGVQNRGSGAGGLGEDG